MTPFTINLLLFLGVLAYIAVCIFLILIVLVQEGKSGGFGADSSGQSPESLSQSFGAGGSQKFLFRATATIGAIFFLIAIGLTIMGEQKEQVGGALDLLDDAPLVMEPLPTAPGMGAAPPPAPPEDPAE